LPEGNRFFNGYHYVGPLIIIMGYSWEYRGVEQRMPFEILTEKKTPLPNSTQVTGVLVA
jgi:hypothetical protein